MQLESLGEFFSDWLGCQRVPPIGWISKAACW